MTKEQIIQQKKNEALNKIRKIYHPLAKNNYGHHSEGSYGEQRNDWVGEIIKKLERDIKLLKKP